MTNSDSKPVLVVLASTYPRWKNDHEPSFVHELSQRLCSRFHVIVLCPHAAGAKNHERLDGVEVRRFRYAPARLETLINGGGMATNVRHAKWKWLLVPLFLVAQFLMLLDVLWRRNVDVIHAHWVIPQGVIACVARSLVRSQSRLVITSHGADVFGLRGATFDWIRRQVLRRADATTVVSRALLLALSKQVRSNADIRVIPMGVDLKEKFTPDLSAARDPHLILFVGRLVEKKGVIHLIHAMPAVRQRVAQARLKIVGFGPDEPVLRAAVQRLGLGDSVEFAGPSTPEALPDIYREAGLFVAPFIEAGSGDQEGLGLVVIEALGCGCAVVVGNVCAVADTLGDYFREVTVNPRNESELSHRIIDVLLSKPTSQSALAAAVRLRFDWQAISDEYADLLLHAQKDDRVAQRH